MKLELLNILSSRSHELLIQMRGESGEVYHFQGGVSGDQRVEDMLTHIAGEIAATRRKKPRPTYKVKSIMPKSWGKLRSALLGPLPKPIDPRKVIWSKQAFETGLPGVRDPIKPKAKRVKR